MQSKQETRNRSTIRYQLGACAGTWYKSLPLTNSVTSRASFAALAAQRLAATIVGLSRELDVAPIIVGLSRVLDVAPIIVGLSRVLNVAPMGWPSLI